MTVFATANPAHSDKGSAVDAVKVSHTNVGHRWEPLQAECHAPLGTISLVASTDGTTCVAVTAKNRTAPISGTTSRSQVPRRQDLGRCCGEDRCSSAPRVDHDHRLAHDGGAAERFGAYEVTMALSGVFPTETW